MKTQTKKLLLRLEELSTQNDKNIFERIKTAAEVMADLEWIATAHAGDDFAAIDHLEDRYFKSLAGYVKLPTLLNVFRAFPDEAKWKEYRYDLKAMEILYEEQKVAADQDDQPRKHVRYKEVADHLKEELEQVTFQAKRNGELLGVRETEVETLRRRVAELEHENAMLEGRLKELERIANRQLQAA